MIHRLISFNEKALIWFDEESHTYTYKEEKLSSATRFVKEYEDEFDSNRVAQTCSLNWGEEVEDILTLWDSNGKAASGFGTAIHAVLEHYFTHKAIGARIQLAARKGKNAAMPNHPFLQELITSLETIRTDGDTRQEVCISMVKNGLCGLVDDLLITDANKKRCRIRDYKITADILVEGKPLKKPFAYLGSNKLAKNYLQLAFYSYLMSMSGWTVEGIDIFNWNGAWTKYTLEGSELTKTIMTIGTLCQKA